MESKKEGTDRIELGTLVLVGALAGGMAWACYSGLPLAGRMAILEEKIDRELVRATERHQEIRRDIGDLSGQLGRVVPPGSHVIPAAPAATMPVISRVSLCVHPVHPGHPWCAACEMVSCDPQHTAHP